MPNAKDVPAGISRRSFIVAGKAGSGKTTQFLTLPGKKFAYLFDPNALESLRGYDVDYEEFLPDKLEIGVTSLSDKGKVRAQGISPIKPASGHELFRRWEVDIEDRMAKGGFDEYDIIVFDSFTTLSDMVMDAILSINMRGGQWPQIDDYGPQMLALSKIFRRVNTLGKVIYVTAHTETKQDENTKRLINELMMTGRLKAKLPLLFSEMLIMNAEGQKGGMANYTVQTRPDRYNESCRCSIKTAKFLEDVTIDWNKDPVGQGLGGLYKGLI